MRYEIINFIREHRISTCNVVDALEQNTVYNLQPMAKRSHAVGEVHFLHSFCGSNWITHKELAAAPQGRILFIHPHGSDLAVIGGLMAEYAFEYKRAVAVVVNGNIRDADDIDRHFIWYRGVTPMACNKMPIATSSTFIERLRRTHQDGIMVCDASGVALIEPGQINKDTYNRLVSIKEREREWMRKLQKGMSTFEITCFPE